MRGGARRINETQDGAADAELNAVAIAERGGRGDAPAVEQRAVEAGEINKRELPVMSLNFGVATRDDRRRRVHRHARRRVAAEQH